MSFLVTQTPDARSAALEMESRCELRDIALLRCLADGAGPALTPPHHPVPLAVSSATEYHLRDHDLEAELTITVAAEPELAFRIDATILLKYSITVDFRPTEDQVKAFCESSALANAWPYARQLVQDLSGRMGLPTSPLPTLRFLISSGPPAGKRKSRRAPRRK